MNAFKNFEDFKYRADNEYINDLFYFFKGHVQDKEWNPQTEVTFYGLNNEFNEGITFTLGEARDFLRENYSKTKTEEVANSFSERVKAVEAWTPEKSTHTAWTPPVEQAHVTTTEDDFGPEIGRDVLDDEEYEEIFNTQEDEEPEEEESFEEFLEDFLSDDEDSDHEDMSAKDKDKKKKRKVKVLGEELPFEDDNGSNHQKEMATQKAIVDDAKSRHEGDVEDDGYRDNGESSNGLEHHNLDDGLLEIDFGDDWTNSEEAKLAKLAEKQEQSSINPILGVMGGISKVFNSKDYEYQGEDAKLFGQRESEEINIQKEAATEAAIIELAKQRAAQNVQVELIEEDLFEQSGISYDRNEINKNNKTMEEALNETINKMGASLDDIDQYDEHGQVIHPEIIIDKMLSEDENAGNAFKGQGSAGDMSAFGQAFKDFASQIGNDNNSGYGNGNNVADILNGLVMGMAFTGSGDQIRESSPEPVVTPTSASSTEHVRGVHESVDGKNLGVESGFNLDDYGNLKTAAQERYEAEKRDSYEIGQDTRDIQKFVDAAALDKDARDALMVQSYGQEMVPMPANTMMQGEDFNRLYMEHFADVTAVEFSAIPIPENVNTVDFSIGGNGAVLGYEENGVLYITAAPPAGSDLSVVTEPQVYLNPDSAGMFKDAVCLQSVSFGDNVADTSYVYNMGGMFINCENLTTVNADYLNTERLQNIDGLFANCSNLETFNNEGWRTNSIITASFAFSECHALTQDPSANWNMESLRYADGFMSGCISLTNIDMSSWNARNLLSTREMFNGCSVAEHININGLDTVNVRDMAGMFKCCENLEDVNFSKLNTSSLSPVVSEKGGAWSELQENLGHPIDDIFYGCTKLVENGEFKSHAMAWELSANRSVELNSPVYMESKSKSFSHEQLSIPITTEVQNRDGSMSKMTSYHNQDGSTTFVIPSETPHFNYEKIEEFQHKESPVIVMSKPNNDGTTSIITSKTYADNSRIVQTEVVGVDGQVIQSNVVSYDKFGAKTRDVPLSNIDEIIKNNPVFVTSKLNKDGSFSVITSKTYEDNSKIVKTETYGKDGAAIKEAIISFDGNGMKMTDVPSSKMEDFAMVSAAIILTTVNRDGTASIITSKTYADNSHVVKTEMFGRDGNMIKENMAAYDKNGVKMFSVPADKMQDIQQDVSKLSFVKVNMDGTVSIATTKTFADNSKIVNTEVFGQQGIVKNAFAAYDKNGVQISTISESKLEELAKMRSLDVSFNIGKDDNVVLVTTKTYSDKSQIVKTEEFSKNGQFLKDSIVGYDKNGIQLQSITEAKLNELIIGTTVGVNLRIEKDGANSVVTSKMFNNNTQIVKTEIFAKNGAAPDNYIVAYDKNGNEINNVPTERLEKLIKTNVDTVDFKTNNDGTIAITSSKINRDATQIVKTEVLSKNGDVVKDSVTLYDKNGVKISEKPVDRLEEALATGAILVTSKVDKEGVASVVTEKIFADKIKVVQTETIDKNGRVIKDVVGYDINGKQAVNIASDKLSELAAAKKLEINQKIDGHQVIITVPKNDGTKAKTTIEVSKDGKHITKTIVQGIDGSIKDVKKSSFGSSSKEQEMQLIKLEDRGKNRRKEKGNEGHVFGNSKSSNERKIYDAAKLKRDQSFYKTGKVVEEFGKGAKPVLSAAYKAAKSLADNPQDDSLMAETSKKMEKYKGVTKSVVSGIFGVSIAASLKAEQIDFKKTMKAAQVTRGIEGKLKDNGITLASLQDKSQKEVVQALSGLKDSHGQKLLSDKQIRDIAKYRNGAVDMVNFQKTVDNARNAGLFQKISKDGKALTDRQQKALEKFNMGRLNKMSAKDISAITDAYFERASSSSLYGLKPSALSKRQLDDILSGKDSLIDVKKLSETEKDMLKAARKSRSLNEKKRDVKNNQALKRMQPFSLNNMIKAMQKTGSGIAQDAAQLISDIRRKGNLVYTGAYTIIQVASIYSNLGLRGAKFIEKGFAKTKPGSIIIKWRGEILSAIGDTPLGKSVKSVKKAKADWKEAKALKKQARQIKKTQRNLDRKQAIKDGAQKVVDKAKDSAAAKAATKAMDKAKRTTAGKAVAKAAGKAKMITERTGKTVNAIGNVIAAPFKGLAWAGGKLGALVNTVKQAASKFLIYLAAGIAGFFLLAIVFVAIISMFTGGGSTGTMLNMSIMGPPPVDELGNELNLTEEEYAERWEDFRELIQERYQDSRDAQSAVLDNVEDIFNSVPVINGSPVIGWSGDRILEYGVPSDPDNQGCWIAYKPVADDNAKDAIAFAYVIMGTEDFYYKESARNKLIEDLISAMNPKVDETNIINTINPMATYADEDKKIYACLTGCDTLTYYCADDEAYSLFSKSGCKGKNKDYTGASSVKDLKGCVRLSTDGTEIVTNGEKIPNVAEPVIYADNLFSHKYGDSYTSTCTGDETVEIYYEYKYETNGMVRTYDADEYGNYKYNDYDHYKYFPTSDCQRECMYSGGAHYHFYDRYDNLLGFKGAYDMKVPGIVTATGNGRKTVKIKDLGYTHNPTSGNYVVSGGIDDEDQVNGPTKTIVIPENELMDYIKTNVLSRDKRISSARLTSDIDSNCSSWKVRFKCGGHDINTCPNGHTDLGVTISQYSVEDFACFNKGGSVPLPTDRLYQQYINDFLNLDTRDGALEMIKTIVENDWAILYGISSQNTLSIAENSKIGEAYIYNILVSEPKGDSLGLGMSKAQAAALLGYIKVGSDFKINAKVNGYYGLCLWGEDQLERIGRGSSDNTATLLEQLILLNNEWANTISSCGFEKSNDFIEFRGCEDTVAGVKKAAEILTTKWTFGHVENVEAVQIAAVEYFNRMETGSDKDFSNPCLATVSNYVTWAMKTAASPEHGYCQGKFQAGSTGDFACGTFVSWSVAEGTRGTDDEVAGWPNDRFQVLYFPDGATEADLQFGDLIYDPMEGGDTSDHIEIYIGNGCSVGARGADGNYGCSQSDERWTKHPSSWTDHVFHKAGDQGIRWKNGDYMYDEIAASSSDLSKYKIVYRLKP